MEIKRDAYLQQLIERKDNGMIKVITGIRRCGKSFLLFTIFKRYLLENGVGSDHIIEIALDGIENEELRDPKMCFKYIKDAVKDDGKYYLLLDEVQFMPRFEEVLNSLLRMSNIDVYVTGNNSKFLSSDIVTEFRGRCVFNFHLCAPHFCVYAHFLVTIFYHKTRYVSIFIPILCVYVYFYVMH